MKTVLAPAELLWAEWVGGNDEVGMSNGRHCGLRTFEFALRRTGSAEDGPEWQKHIGNKKQRRKLANRFKDINAPFRIVIVREGEAPRRLCLTGFDAPYKERQKYE